MLTFVQEHAALLLKHARQLVRTTGANVPVEDVSREAEMLALQIGEGGVQPSDIASPDAFLRAVVAHAVGRVRRRRTLVEQIAAGDDLEAVSQDVAAVDRDLPVVPVTPTPAQKQAYETLDGLKHRLPPADALVCALLFEDELGLEGTAQVLTRPVTDIEAARERILFTAAEMGIEGEPDARAAPGTPPDLDKMRELKLRALGRLGAPPPSGARVNEAIVRLIRDGDNSEDIADAVTQVAFCPDSRAVLIEGEFQKRTIVVMAIEAPRDATREIEKAAEGARAKLLERGMGRWTAVMDASQASNLRERLEKEESSVVSRLAMAAPVDVPQPASRRTLGSMGDFAVDSGISAAEVQAWAQVAQQKKKRVVESLHLGWVAFAVVAIAGAAGLAYFLAIH